MLFDFRRAIFAPTFALALCALAGAGHAEEDGRRHPTALSPADRLSYTTAFDALRRGDLDAARASAREANDRVLLGQVEFERLFHADYSASYEELAGWLEEYADLPAADRAYNLAMRRRPDGAPEPRQPSRLGVNRTWNSIAAAGGNTEGDPMKAARVALNRDNLSDAVILGEQLGDWWTVGLAQYRLGEFGKATTAFERVLDNPTEDGWIRSGAAFWAARSAARSGQRDRVQPLLRRAGTWPASFYGQIALRQLGEEPVIENLGPRPYQPAGLQQASYQPDEPIGADTDELDAFIRSEPRALRTVAFFEVGRRTDARDELRIGLREAVTDNGRRLWAALGRALGPRVIGASDDARRIDAGRYPQPVIEPDGGFTIERSLVYAIARKESDFNARARSGAGAYGLMQVMPTTAAELSGDRAFVRDPERLFQPNVNARLGQAYVNRVLALPAINGDLLRAAASYNAGPGPMVAAVRKLGHDADPLLLIETIDVPQARDYVEKVVAAYWIYQRMNGQPLNTLDAVASGATLIPLSLDYVAPPPVPPQAVEVASVSAVSANQTIRPPG
ncbi:MAG: lytic transglycosylase domain-containing protein [Brevundimonas sp.]|uniref:lytic transglycosylase domain-containing protein n=1 Tax=Brevundimonas sp. TaxID=1871086 RepID=UPI0027353124|nr:lytic transglycosylase domain-containing protein [Brevundimonas sp.]MDP3655712.1 lytic transglycosylase domain-containing protein [Brevundimonas sp.]MDZ4108556.1 lytic transglycosylase domain-containing protein [Brevundimonas sp.]